MEIRYRMEKYEFPQLIRRYSRSTKPGRGRSCTWLAACIPQTYPEKTFHLYTNRRCRLWIEGLRHLIHATPFSAWFRRDKKTFLLVIERHALPIENATAITTLRTDHVHEVILSHTQRLHYRPGPRPHAFSCPLTSPRS